MRLANSMADHAFITGFHFFPVVNEVGVVPAEASPRCEGLHELEQIQLARQVGR